jgi:hypothetical protein
MTDQKTIVITWNDTRPGHDGEILAALWVAKGTDDDLNAALQYVSVNARGYGYSSRVHTFPVDQSDWKTAALAAHNAGCGL